MRHYWTSPLIYPAAAHHVRARAESWEGEECAMCVKSGEIVNRCGDGVLHSEASGHREKLSFRQHPWHGWHSPRRSDATFRCRAQSSYRAQNVNQAMYEWSDDGPVDHAGNRKPWTGR